FAGGHADGLEHVHGVLPDHASGRLWLFPCADQTTVPADTGGHPFRPAPGDAGGVAHWTLRAGNSVGSLAIRSFLVASKNPGGDGGPSVFYGFNQRPAFAALV